MVGHRLFEVTTDSFPAVAGTASLWMTKGRSQPRSLAFSQNVAQGVVS
jgi:hypothetical protein